MNPLAKIFLCDFHWKLIPQPKSHVFNGNMSKTVCRHQLRA